MKFIKKVNNLNFDLESKFEFKKSSDSLQVEADCFKEFFPYYKQFIEFGVLGVFCIFVIYVFFFLEKDGANHNIIYFLVSLLFIVLILLYILYSKKEENIIFNFSESGISIGTKSKPNLFFIEPLNIEDIYPNVILIEKYRKNCVKGYAIILKCKKPIFLNLKGYKDETESVIEKRPEEPNYYKIILKTNSPIFLKPVADLEKDRFSLFGNIDKEWKDIAFLLKRELQEMLNY